MHSPRTGKKAANQTLCQCTKYMMMEAKNMGSKNRKQRRPSATRSGNTESASEQQATGDGFAVGTGDVGGVVGAGCRCSGAAQRPSEFGVCVDMSSMFADERRACWMWIEARRPVAWLVTRLAERVPLPRAPACLALLAPLGLLHPDDPLALLNPGDTLRVIPLESRLFRGECYNGTEECNDECLQTCTKDPCQVNMETSLYRNDNESYCSTKEKGCCVSIISPEEHSCCREALPGTDCCTRGTLACTETRVVACSAQEQAHDQQHSPCPSPLRAMKQRALDLLNRYEQSVHSASPSPPRRPRAHSTHRERSPPPRIAHADASSGGDPGPGDDPGPGGDPGPDADVERAVDVPDAPCGDARGGGGGGGEERERSGRTRRRRVRRRPRRPSPLIAPLLDAPQVDALPASSSRDSSVVRNAETRALAPRRVHALAV